MLTGRRKRDKRTSERINGKKNAKHMHQMKNERTKNLHFGNALGGGGMGRTMESYLAQCTKASVRIKFMTAHGLN